MSDQKTKVFCKEENIGNNGAGQGAEGRDLNIQYIHTFSADHRKKPEFSFTLVTTKKFTNCS